MDTDTISILISSLQKNRITASYFRTPVELMTALSGHLVPDTVVGVGDSRTMEELGIYEMLGSMEIEYLDKYEPGLSREQKEDLYRRNFTADLFLSGVNAITLEGRIFNLDGNGSRVAPIIYGPGKVLLICGTNKIVKNDDEAIDRIRNIAAPIDARRLNKRTPCVKTGTCMDCRSADKICNYYTITQGQFNADRIEVFVINGDYGF